MVTWFSFNFDAAGHAGHLANVQNPFSQSKREATSLEFRVLRQSSHLLSSKLSVGHETGATPQEYVRRADGSRSLAKPVEWFDGRHDAVISTDLFDRCQLARARWRAHRFPTVRTNYYLLHDLLYCYQCSRNPPEGRAPLNLGKMRCQSQGSTQVLYYRCRARQLGYQCRQQGVRINGIDSELIEILTALDLSETERARVATVSVGLLEERRIQSRLERIRQIILGLRLHFDLSFTTSRDDFVSEYATLESKVKALPSDDDSLYEIVRDRLDYFTRHWTKRRGDQHALRELVETIVERVYVEATGIAAVSLHSGLWIRPGSDQRKRPTS